MARKYSFASDTLDRAGQSLRAVLPRSVKVQPVKGKSLQSGMLVNDQLMQIGWLGEGQLGEVRRLLADRHGKPDVVVARRMSPGACQALSDAGIGWVDETGAAEIAFGTILVSRTGRQVQAVEKAPAWSPAVIAIAEALLCGTRATVAATGQATGLSAGSCTNALRVLGRLGLLESKAKRGPGSARLIPDFDQFLAAYAEAVASLPRPVSLQVGALWRDPVAGLAKVGKLWDKTGTEWAATGAVAAAVMAPYLTDVTTTEVYVNAGSIIALEAVAADAGLAPIEGGRLTLKAFPSVAVRRLAGNREGLRLAPWPRVYVDLRTSGVRGEEAAEHLREVFLAG